MYLQFLYFAKLQSKIQKVCLIFLVPTKEIRCKNTSNIQINVTINAKVIKFKDQNQKVYLQGFNLKKNQDYSSAFTHARRQREMLCFVHLLNQCVTVCVCVCVYSCLCEQIFNSDL